MTPSVVEEGVRFVVNINPIVRLGGIALLAKIPNAQKQAEYQSSREQTGKHWPHPDFTDIFDSVHGSSFCGAGSTFTRSDISIVRALNSGVASGNKLKCQCGYR